MRILILTCGEVLPRPGNFVGDTADHASAAPSCIALLLRGIRMSLFPVADFFLISAQGIPRQLLWRRASDTALVTHWIVSQMVTSAHNALSCEAYDQGRNDDPIRRMHAHRMRCIVVYRHLPEIVGMSRSGFSTHNVNLHDVVMRSSASSAGARITPRWSFLMPELFVLSESQGGQKLAPSCDVCDVGCNWSGGLRYLRYAVPR